MIKFNCPDCGQKVAVGDELAGKKGRCPKCKQVVTIPTPSAPPEPEEHGLALEDGLEAEARGTPEEDEERRKCAGCGAPMAEVLVVCPRCGMNRETGMRVGEFLFGERGSQEEEKGKRGWLLLAGGIGGGAALVILVVVLLMALLSGDKEEKPMVSKGPKVAAVKPELPPGTKTEPKQSPAEARKPEPSKEEKPRMKLPTDVIVKDYLGTVVGQISRTRDKTTLRSIEHSIRAFQALEGRFPKSLEELESAGYPPPPPPEGIRYDYDPKTGKVHFAEEERKGVSGTGTAGD